MGMQQATLPVFIVWLQALSVPVLGFFAGWIAYQQWRTAERKVQLNLFDRRIAIYEAARNALLPVMREARATGEDIVNFRVAVDRAYLLFGDDVVNECSTVAKALGSLMAHGDRFDLEDLDRGKHIDASEKAMIRISEFYENMPKLLERYMKLDRKLSSRYHWFDKIPGV